MVNKLINSELGTAFVTDPSIALWTYVKSIWDNATGYTVPVSTAIKFDTKFGEQKGFTNFWIVENMPTFEKSQIIGGTRYEYEDVKRIQILCVGPSAKNKKWNMERHTDSLINANLTGMRTTYGIKTMNLSGWTELNMEENSKQTSMIPQKNFQTARSFATVTLRYEQEATTV